MHPLNRALRMALFVALRVSIGGGGGGGSVTASAVPSPSVVPLRCRGVEHHGPIGVGAWLPSPWLRRHARLHHHGFTSPWLRHRGYITVAATSPCGYAWFCNLTRFRLRGARLVPGPAPPHAAWHGCCAAPALNAEPKKALKLICTCRVNSYRSQAQINIFF